MDAATRAELVARYRAGHAAILASLAGIEEAGLDARPADGGWTPREVVHHTADSEMTSAIRLRRLIAEENPTIVGYDGDTFAARLHYADRPIEPALEAIAGARSTTAQILDRLTEPEWLRSGTHTESGAYGVERWLEIYAFHCDEHADQIRRARAESDH
ncbi:MAG TPA: DinB family protein [Candidatus Dormibacteraeota bacterium]|nr:DinB family protein [Candidatus Dormibacteraeota bacterium]